MEVMILLMGLSWRSVELSLSWRMMELGMAKMQRESVDIWCEVDSRVVK